MIYFRHEHSLRGLNIALARGEEVTFEWRSDRQMRATFRAEQAADSQRTQIVVSISTSDEPSIEIAGMFNSLLRGEMPEGSVTKEVAQASSLDKSFSPPSDLYPRVLQQYLHGLHEYLNDSFRRLLGLLAWRSGAYGAPKAVSNTAEWSLDGTVWTRLAQRKLGFVSIMLTPNVTDEIRLSVEEMMTAGVEAPTSQELLREAWELRHTNPRSALLLSMAAVEVGLKECVSELIPEADWLVFNVPSPPLLAMLKHFLPLLPVKAGTAQAPIKSIMRVLDDSIKQRNYLAHQGALDVSRQELDEFLDVARELLLQFDLYRGNTWAAKIQPRIRS